MNTVELGGKFFNAEGYIRTENGEVVKTIEGTEGAVPLVNFPMMSDYKWQLSCLESRLAHPEWYAEREDVNAVIASLRKWLEDHKPEGVNVA